MRFENPNGNIGRSEAFQVLLFGTIPKKIEFSGIGYQMNIMKVFVNM